MKYNIIAVISGLASFGIGSLSPNLSLFRGVSVTFFVFFLLQKWIEIRWRRYWSIALLGIGGFIYLVCIYIKGHLEYFT
jgi:hypothetical protein